MEKQKIIGQDKLVTMFDRMIENNTLPRFITLTGERGSGRKTLAKYIADKLNASLYKPDNKISVDYIRDITTQAYQQTSPVVYLLPDADVINTASANALLKVTEEPPNNAYFILTCCDGRYIPATIKSRCITYRLEPYSLTTLKEFAKELNVDTSNNDQLFRLCETPGQIIDFVQSELNYKDLEEFTIKVVDNVGKVSGANVFKIDESIAFKEDDTGFNLNTFWTMFCNICLQRAKDIKNSKRHMYFSYIRVTGEYREKLTIIGINKRSLFDLWLLEIRDIYEKYN